MQVKKQQNWTWKRLVPVWKGVHQSCTLSSYLFNLHAEYTMRNARQDEAQAGIMIAGRNINNLRYADDPNIMAESKEELKDTCSWEEKL